MKPSPRLFWSIRLVILCVLPVHLAGQSRTVATLKAIEEKVYYYPRQAERMLDSLLQQPPIEIENDHLGELNFLQGFLSYHKGEMDTALNHMETALMTFTRNDQPEWQGKCYLLMGWIAEGDSYLEQAKIYYYETIRLLDDKPEINTGLAYLGLARCKKILNEAYSEELIKGVEYLEAVGKDEFSLYAHFVYLMIKINEPGSTKQLLEIADRYLEVGLDDKVPNVYKALASYYLQIKELDSAHIYVDKAIEEFDDSYPGESLIPALHQLKGNIYYAQHNFDAARKLYLQALELYESYGQMTRSFYVYLSLYQLDRREHDYKGALENLMKANKYQNQANLKEKQRMAKALETAAGIGLLHEEILNYKKRNQLLVFSIIVFFAISVIIVIVGFFKYRERTRQKERINSEIQTLIASYRERELSIQRIENSREDIQKGLDKSLKGKMIDDIYPELLGLVSQSFGILSKTEQSCALMFAMGLTQETIAQLQNVQPDTIRRTKQRIRKKLDLPAETDLELFLQKQLKL